MVTGLLGIGVLRYLKFSLNLPLCRKHHWSRMISTVLGVLIIFLGISVVVSGFVFNSYILLYGGIFMVIPGVIVAAVKGTPISIRKLKNPYVWLSGIDKGYLASLPQWTN
jgi:hypothetical protein